MGPNMLTVWNIEILKAYVDGAETERGREGEGEGKGEGQGENVERI